MSHSRVMECDEDFFDEDDEDSRFELFVERQAARVVRLSHTRWAWAVCIPLAIAASAIYLVLQSDLAWWLCPLGALPLFFLMLGRLFEDENNDLVLGDMGTQPFGSP